MLALLLFACETSDLGCREGTTLAEDGHCYPPLLDPSPRIEDVIAGLPACEPATGPGEIDLAAGCAYGACAGDTYTEMAGFLGPIDCVTTSFDAKQVYCYWDEWGINGRFIDNDENDIPDENARTERLHLYRPSTAATAEGVGVDANLKCFFDGLGMPDTLEIRDTGGSLLPYLMFWSRFQLQALDDTGPGGDRGSDGYIDDLFIFQ